MASTIAASSMERFDVERADPGAGARSYRIWRRLVFFKINANQLHERPSPTGQ
jgi:hypothetical protein